MEYIEYIAMVYIACVRLCGQVPVQYGYVGTVEPKKSRVWVVWFGYIPKIYVFIILRNELYVIVRKSSAKIN